MVGIVVVEGIVVDYTVLAVVELAATADGPGLLVVDG